MGTSSRRKTPQKTFGGPQYEGCNEYLVHTGQAVEKVHRDFLAGGADVIETDTLALHRLC